MELIETRIHSFVIRLWLEETNAEAGVFQWRGHITHIPSNQHRYFDKLKEMKQFVKQFLGSMDSSIQDSD